MVILPVEVKPGGRKVVMPNAAPVEEQLPSGLDLVKRIYEAQLRAYDGVIKSAKQLDTEDIRAVKEIAGTLIDIEKAERDRKRADKWGDKLANLSEEQLWAIVNSKQ